MRYKYYHKNKKDRFGWLRWFAWKPVPLGGYPRKDGATMVWWEWIERKWLDSREGSSRYNYRLPKPAPTSMGIHRVMTVAEGLKKHEANLKKQEPAPKRVRNYYGEKYAGLTWKDFIDYVEKAGARPDDNIQRIGPWEHPVLSNFHIFRHGDKEQTNLVICEDKHL